jgi:hypothetical protein
MFFALLALAAHLVVEGGVAALPGMLVVDSLPPGSVG